MDIENIKKILADLHKKKISEKQALERLKYLTFESLGFANIDHHRELRQGFPEVIYCEGKTPQQVVRIAQKIVARGSSLLATRGNRKIFQALKAKIPRVVYNPIARTITLKSRTQTAQEDRVQKRFPPILIITGGTSDIPVAEEALVTVEMMGWKAEKIIDVGVAGIHRLLNHKEKLIKAPILIVIAGMEGALASVIGGLVDKPVIAVPTSSGYGANFQGLAALLAMLNSCASGVMVVNINNGFGAGFAACQIMNLIVRKSL